MWIISCAKNVGVYQSLLVFVGDTVKILYLPKGVCAKGASA